MESKDLEFKQKLSSIKMELQYNAKFEFHKQFLELTTLKVGDIVECSFPYNTGDRQKAYISTGVKKGILKQYESGLLYVESVDPLPKSKHVTNGRSGRDYSYTLKGPYNEEDISLNALIEFLSE